MAPTTNDPRDDLPAPYRAETTVPAPYVPESTALSRYARGTTLPARRRDRGDALPVARRPDSAPAPQARRYDAREMGDGDVLVYDVARPDAWIRSSESTALDDAA